MQLYPLTYLQLSPSLSISTRRGGIAASASLFPSLNWGNHRAPNETMIEPIKKARLCIYYKKCNKGPGLMPWGWGHTSSRARLIMNANKHNESNESERGAATSFGKPLGNSTWHVSGVLLITQRETETHIAAETMMYSHQPDREGEGKWNRENKRLADKVCKKAV